jgi:hypothetical protein
MYSENLGRHATARKSRKNHSSKYFLDNPANAVEMLLAIAKGKKMTAKLLCAPVADSAKEASP